MQVQRLEKHTVVRLARSVRPERPTPVMLIEGREEIGDKNGVCMNAEEVFASDAAVICDALFSCLPGGTIDRLVVAMLSRTASSLTVPKH